MSSRQNRAKDAKSATQQRPEDFMDDEDIREAEEAKTLSTTDDFAGLGTTEEDTMRGGGLMDILKVTDDTVGVKLLKKMGWREGQGIGPKIRRRARSADGEDGDQQAHLFAPDDPAMISFTRKTDEKGLGYDGEARPSRIANLRSPSPEESEEEGERGSSNIAFKKYPAARSGSKTGFGVGILNDNGSDEEDPYQIGPKMTYSKVLGGSRKSEKKRKSAIGAANPLLKSKPVFLSKKSGAKKGQSGFRKSHDGRLPLEGFILSTELDSFANLSFQDEKYRPPKVPEGWQSSKKSQTPSGKSSYLSSADAAKVSTLNAQSRSALLGEEALLGKSVFDFITPATRAKIAAASGKSDLPAARGEKPPSGFELSEDQQTRRMQDLVPQLDSDVAVQALARGLGGWMPYAEDEAKRVRYRAYLETQAGTRNALPNKAQNMSLEDWVIEMQEFARAAQVFRPVGGLMASRFTSASSHLTKTGDSTSADESLLSRPAVKADDPAVAAAKLGMFGPMTRSVQNFYPSRLLCKRFNVRAPDITRLDDDEMAETHIQSRIDASDDRGKPPLTTDSAHTVHIPQPTVMLESSGTNQAGDDGMGAQNNGPGLVVIDADRNEHLESERPGKAVFKAIFGSSDEDE